MFSHWGLHEKFQPPTNIWQQVQKVGTCKALAKLPVAKETEQKRDLWLSNSVWRTLRATLSPRRMKNESCRWSRAGAEGVYRNEDSPYSTSKQVWQNTC